MTTTERITHLIEKSGKSEYAIKKETGLGNSVFSDLKSGRAENPSAKTLKTLATYFNVSVDYLLCLSDFPVPINEEKTKNITVAPQFNDDTLSMEDVKLMLTKNDGLDYIEKLYIELDEQQKTYVITWIIAYMISEGFSVKQILER